MVTDKNVLESNEIIWNLVRNNSNQINFTHTHTHKILPYFFPIHSINIIVVSRNLGVFQKVTFGMKRSFRSTGIRHRSAEASKESQENNIRN